MDGKVLIPYIEPVYRFCHHRLDNWHDAEDLAGEILLHILDGIGKYEIESLEAWVWRIAHNRYARFIDAGNKRQSILSGQELDEVAAECRQMDEPSVEEEYEPVFCYLHTLSTGYRDIFVDYYIGEMPVRQLAQKYALSEATIKWRLNVGRSRIRERIGKDKMDKVYKRINWNTHGCNGSMDSNRYLHSQVARAVCRAAYEKPVTVEEISMYTGIPTIYIEDELPGLIYGDAIRENGNKYTTDFIVFRMEDRAAAETVLEPMVKAISDYYERLLWQGEDFRKIGFYGCEFGMERLGYILIPYLLRQKLEYLKNNRLHLPSGSFPPRKDGGNGWFIVSETADANEEAGAYSTGCNANGTKDGHVYFYWTNKFYDRRVYSNGGTAWLGENGIPRKCPGGIVPEGLIGEEDMVRLVQNNLVRKEGKDYALNFAYFTRTQFDDFRALYKGEDENTDAMLCDWILSVRKSFEGFVPRRLHGQINQWISVYCGELIGHVIEELIRRERLEDPGNMRGDGGLPETTDFHMTRPFVNGVFFVEGEFMPV